MRIKPSFMPFFTHSRASLQLPLGPATEENFWRWWMPRKDVLLAIRFAFVKKRVIFADYNSAWCMFFLSILRSSLCNVDKNPYLSYSWHFLLIYCLSCNFCVWYFYSIGYIFIYNNLIKDFLSLLLRLFQSPAERQISNCATTLIVLFFKLLSWIHLEVNLIYSVR